MAPLLATRPRAERTFERIYRRHVGDVYRYCFAVLRNASDAEDVAQTTFLNAYRAYQRGERPRDPHNWLIAIAHNVCRQRFRQSQRRVEEVEYDDAIGDGVAPEDDAPTAEDIRRALDQLAFNQRAALVMRELEGRSYAEIAAILDVSVSAVETLLFRARRAVREQLEGTLTCRAAELAISKQLDGELPRDERGQLRAHLRECKACATVARKQRAQRAAIRALGTVPVPASLASLFGGGSAAAAGGAIASGAALKAAAVVAAGVVTAGAGYELSREPATPARPPAVAAPAARSEAAAVHRPVSFDARPPALAVAARPTGAASARQAAPAAARPERADRPARAGQGRSKAAAPGRKQRPAKTKPARPQPADRGSRPEAPPKRAAPKGAAAKPAAARPAATPRPTRAATPAARTKPAAAATRPRTAKPRPAKPRPAPARPATPPAPAKPAAQQPPKPKPVVPVAPPVEVPLPGGVASVDEP
ncbi:MAG TPA: sigma-70 family RNA polymerase sigma factor [Gaiellaceae bacterium]|nr:sigma-70 family RNA polymerase sigma factor [Gaiellaceae bacterium]